MANCRCILIFLFVVYLGKPIHGTVEGRDILNENRKLPKAKGTIKTIECPEDGDVIDCIDFWKQPAFNNPLTKKFHESIQLMKPSTTFPGALNKSAKPSRPFHAWNKYGECPKGTIPIKRIQKNNNATIHHRKHPKGVSNAESVHEYAIVQAPGGTYHGVRATINYWKPFVYAEPGSDEFSLAQIWVVSQVGGRETLNSIEAGWIVYPNQFTSATRRFIYSTSDGYTTGCYNVDEDCPGFVVEHESFSFACNTYFSRYDNRDQYEEVIELTRDPTSRAWYLIINGVKIGYWPPSHLTSLQNGADRIDWGGEIAYNAYDDGHHTTTEMGSGHFAYEGWKRAAYFRMIMFQNANQEWEHLNIDLSSTTVSSPNCYDLILGDDGTADHTYFYFGGPGGRLCDRVANQTETDKLII